MLLKTITLVIVVLGLFLSFAQPLNAQGLFRQGSKIERKLERQKKVDKREYEKKRLKLIQEHIDRQSPEVQERMKQNRKNSRQWGRHKKLPFYKRWFRKKSN